MKKIFVAVSLIASVLWSGQAIADGTILIPGSAFSSTYPIVNDLQYSSTTIGFRGPQWPGSAPGSLNDISWVHVKAPQRLKEISRFSLNVRPTAADGSGNVCFTTWFQYFLTGVAATPPQYSLSVSAAYAIGPTTALAGSARPVTLDGNTDSGAGIPPYRIELVNNSGPEGFCDQLANGCQDGDLLVIVFHNNPLASCWTFNRAVNFRSMLIDYVTQP